MSSPEIQYDVTRHAPLRVPPALIVMGVSGIGKTTIGSLLAQSMGCRFHEGDDLHSAENVAKMREGTPLSDDDRWPWLGRIVSVINVPGQSACVVSCSALRRIYRDYLVSMSLTPLLFVYPQVDKATIAGRMAVRENHYMPVGQLDSQLQTFEPPADDEPVISVRGDACPEEIVRNILAEIEGRTFATHD
jgi:gluconokinase